MRRFPIVNEVPGVVPVKLNTRDRLLVSMAKPAAGRRMVRARRVPMAVPPRVMGCPPNRIEFNAVADSIRVTDGAQPLAPALPLIASADSGNVQPVPSSGALVTVAVAP